MEDFMNTDKVNQLSKEVAAYCQNLIQQAQKPSKKRAGQILAVVLTALMVGNTTNESGGWWRAG
jgi:hypothetical protein